MQDSLYPGAASAGTPLPVDGWLPGIVWRRVVESPSAAAAVHVEWRDGRPTPVDTLTFAELWRRATRLAARLKNRGVGPGANVGLFVAPSPSWIVAQVAVHLAGAACVPTDKGHTSARLFDQLADARVSVVLADQLVNGWPEEFAVELMGTAVASAGVEPLRGPPEAPDPGSSAYIIYTSGSSGRPKGVCTPHRGLMAFQSAVRGVFGRPEGPFLMLTSAAFDAAIGSLVWALSDGGAFVTVADAMRVDARALGAVIEQLGVARTISLPSVYHRILDAARSGQLDSLRAVLTGGERSTPELVAAHGQRAPSALLVNGYGLTETSIWNTAYRCDPARPTAEVPIGIAVPGSMVLVLDTDRRPTRPGDIGEVYIGGPCLALGYHARPRETDHRFVRVDHGGTSARMYRTGDLARLGADGVLYFAGRADRQVKIRGHRVELGEIEATLQRDGRIECCAVIRQGREERSERTVAFVEPMTSDPDLRERARVRRMAQWSAIDTAVYRRGGGSVDLAEDVSGWHDSYDGVPIPRHEMLRWVSHTVERIGRHRPRRILEIGCGLGLLLLRLAPRCERYVGIDISPEAIEAVEGEVIGRGLEAIVDVKVASAHEVDDRVIGAFDTVVINSVAQHFPDVHYLERVLGSARALIEGRGVIFVGDVRHLAWLDAFHASVGLHRLDPTSGADALIEWVASARRREGELCLDPAYFHTLADRLDGVHHVEIELKAGADHNELTRFRYDVRIFVGDWPERVPPAQMIDWGTIGRVDQVTSVLTEAALPCVIGGVPSGRVGGLLASMDVATSAGATLADVVRAAVDPSGVDPDALCQRVGDHGLRARAFVEPGDPGAFRVAIWSPEAESPLLPALAERSGRRLDTMANDPLFDTIAAEIVPAVESRMREALPPAMVPDLIVPCPSLPRTASGKIDYRRLALQVPQRSSAAATAGPLETEAEHRVAQIWSALLGVEPIGADDGFFDLGGNSLLLADLRQRLEDAFDRQVSMVDLFEHTTVRRLARFVTGDGAHPAAEPRPAAEPGPAAPSDMEATAVAVIGMAMRAPGAVDLDAFWRLIVDDRCHLERTEGPNGQWSAAGILADAEHFDADLFGLNARDATVLDPQHRQFLECAWSALEHAGYRPDRAPGRVGVFGGAGINTYFVNQVLPMLGLDRPSSLLENSHQFRTMMGQSGDFLTTRVSYRLGASGPSVAVQTGCSTGLVAVHLATRSLRSGECDMALAGAVSVRFPQDAVHAAESGMIFSTDGHCRPFDQCASGTVFGNGVGVVVLKPLAAAMADGDPIHAVIRGSAINNDGAERPGFSAPGVAGQRAVIAAALDDAAVEPDTIGYVECHGTATALGDPIEVRALYEARRARGSVNATCALSSVKANIGHLGNAAGIAGFIKATLAVREGVCPGIPGFDALNPLCALDGSPFTVSATTAPWPDDGRLRRAGVSAFGMGGTNAHVVLEAPPRPASAEAGPGLLVLRGRTPELLRQDARRLLDWVVARPSLSIPAICRTLRTTRSVGPCGIWSLVDTHAALRASLRCLAEQTDGALESSWSVLAPVAGGERRCMPAGRASARPATVEAWLGWVAARFGAERADHLAGSAGPPGAEPDWIEDPHAPGSTRCSVPPRPFVRERFWLEAAPSGRPDAPDTAPVPSAATGCFQETWRRVDEVMTDSSRWLVLMSADVSDDPAVEHIAGLFPRVRRADVGHQLLPDDAPPVVISLLGLNNAPAAEGGGLTRGLRDTVRLAGEVARRDGVRLWVVTRGAVSVSGESVCPHQAMIWGYGRTFGLEQPGSWGGLVDLPAALGERAPAAIEGAFGTPEDQLAIRGRRLWGRRLGLCPMPRAGGWQTSGTALITGGTGGLGRLVARWVLARGAERVILASRRGRSSPRLDALCDDRRVGVVRCDVTDRAAIAHLLEVIDIEGPPLRSVMHLAGRAEHAAAIDVTAADLADGLAAKVVGTAHLEAVLGDRELDALVLFSSGAAAWGSAGLASYAAANAFLDAAAVAGRHRGRDVWSIGWGMWDVDGMADAAARDRMTRQGTPPMASADGLSMLDRVLCAPPCNVIVSRFDWPRFTSAYHARRAWPLWSDIGPATADITRSAAPGAVTEIDFEPTPRDGAPIPLDDDAARELVISAMRATLGDDTATSDSLYEFVDDSLLAIELSDALKQRSNIEVPTLVIIDGSMAAIVRFLVERSG